MESITSTYRYVEHDGVRIAFRDLGDSQAPPVVLLHGLFSAGRSWTPFAERLVAAGHRAILVDQRGHGHSSKAATYRFGDFEADLVAVLDELGLDRVDLVGHSLGGQAVSLVAQHQPDRVRRLVIEDAPPPPVRGDRYRGPGLAVLPPRSRVLVVALLPALLLRNRMTRQIDVGMVRAVLREFRRPDPGWWSRLPNITAPTLLLYGGLESHVPGRRLEDMTKLIPDSRMVTIEVGHRVHNNDLDTFSAAVLPFLAADRP